MAANGAPMPATTTATGWSGGSSRHRGVRAPMPGPLRASRISSASLPQGSMSARSPRAQSVATPPAWPPLPPSLRGYIQSAQARWEST